MQSFTLLFHHRRNKTDVIGRAQMKRPRIKVQQERILILTFSDNITFAENKENRQWSLRKKEDVLLYLNG